MISLSGTVNPSSRQSVSADLNGDGSINVADQILLLNFGYGCCECPNFVWPISSSSTSAGSSSSSSFEDEDIDFTSSSSSSRPIGSSSSSSSSSSSEESSSSSSNEFDQAANFSQISTQRSSSIDAEFGIQFYNTGFGGAVADSLNINFAQLSPVSIARGDSYSGIVTFYNGTRIGKYDTVSLEVKNESVKYAGSVPHTVLEDSFEGVNTGLAAGLGQVQNINIVSQRSKMLSMYVEDLRYETNYFGYNMYFAKQKESVERNGSFVTNFDAITESNIDHVSSDIYYKKVISSSTIIKSIGLLQQVVLLEDNKVMVIGNKNIGILDGDLNFEFINFSFEDGENILSANIFDDGIVVCTSNRFVVFDISIKFMYSVGYPGSIGTPICGYGNNSELVLSTSNGIYYKLFDAPSFVRTYIPSISGSNNPDGVYKFIDNNNATIGIGKNIYWTNNNQLFSKVSTETVNYNIRSVAKFFNRYVFATDKGVFVSALNMLGSNSVQASLASQSILPNSPISFIDIAVEQNQVGANLVSATVYAIRSDGVLFISEDPANYFDTIETPIKKPIMLLVKGSDVLVFSNNNVYSKNTNVIKTLTRSL